MVATLTKPISHETLGERVRNANCAGLPRSVFQDLLLQEPPDLNADGICRGCKMFRGENTCPEQLVNTVPVYFETPEE